MNGWDVQSKRIYPEGSCGPTLSSGTGEGMNIQPSVLQSQSIDYKQTPKVNKEISHTLTHEGNGGIHSSVAFKYSAGAAARTMPTYGDGSCNTLTVTARADGSPCVDRGQNVVFCRAGDSAGAETCRNMSPTLMAHCEKGAPLLVHRNETPSPARDEPHEDESHATIHDGSSWVIRRLTPIECERLQGFPDGWTDVPFKGREHPSDTPRYKAIGNSMAVPVMRWIGSRIQMVDEMEVEQ